ncbi:uncharacterized protein LOC125524174 isoform X2 [Triticum urartu]|uniref:uncharacterized protein LOC125524174 isoform X2 n=1 Tax=Triticum urartu TaxID=4572 RepID=UPI0020430275|nr:uncharacterized protein LOC125524174 isoform X2 [Triticum urartu]
MATCWPSRAFQSPPSNWIRSPAPPRSNPRSDLPRIRPRSLPHASERRHGRAPVKLAATGHPEPRGGVRELCHGRLHHHAEGLELGHLQASPSSSSSVCTTTVLAAIHRLPSFPGFPDAPTSTTGCDVLIF